MAALPRFRALGLLLCIAATIEAGDFRLTVNKSGAGATLQAQGAAPAIEGMRAQIQIKASSDLVQWNSLQGQQLILEPGDVGQLTLPPGNALNFFRAFRSLSSVDAQSSGAEIFGYSGAFRQELSRIGFLSVDQFSADHPAPAYRPQITFDPTTAQFWDQLNFDPSGWNSTNYWYQKKYDLRLKTRLSDQDWKEKSMANSLSPHPEWTSGYLVPGTVAHPNPINN